MRPAQIFLLFVLIIAGFDAILFGHAQTRQDRALATVELNHILTSFH